jgi:hypothetical protein
MVLHDEPPNSVAKKISCHCDRELDVAGSNPVSQKGILRVIASCRPVGDIPAKTTCPPGNIPACGRQACDNRFEYKHLDCHVALLLAMTCAELGG